MRSIEDEVRKQRRYYAETGHLYDAMHLEPKDEHFFALCFLIASLNYLEVKSILDIGSGTGRALRYVKMYRPEVRLVGIEPVKELRQVGIESGLTEQELIEGDAMNLDFAAGEFDLVCEFGMLHHVRRPEQVVAEMLRVARKAIFISDCNNFGQGSKAVRTIKQFIDYLGLWKVADLIKTRGRGYIVSKGDGLAYSYSVFNNYKQIRKCCKKIHLINTRDGGTNFYRTASHVALLGIKE